MAQLLLLGGMVLLMYAVIIVPQQRKAKAQRELLNSIAPGDAVLTIAGIYGVVTEIDGNDMYLEVADGIELKVTRSSVAAKLTPTGDAPAASDAAPTGLGSKIAKALDRSGGASSDDAGSAAPADKETK